MFPQDYSWNSDLHLDAAFIFEFPICSVLFVFEIRDSLTFSLILFTPNLYTSPSYSTSNTEERTERQKVERMTWKQNACLRNRRRKYKNCSISAKQMPTATYK